MPKNFNHEKIRSRLTMKKNGRSFLDIVSGETVLYYWIDCYFDTYMAVSRFSMRVKIDDPHKNHLN